MGTDSKVGALIVGADVIFMVYPLGMVCQTQNETVHQLATSMTIVKTYRPSGVKRVPVLGF